MADADFFGKLASLSQEQGTYLSWKLRPRSKVRVAWLERDDWWERKDKNKVLFWFLSLCFFFSCNFLQYASENITRVMCRLFYCRWCFFFFNFYFYPSVRENRGRSYAPKWMRTWCNRRQLNRISHRLARWPTNSWRWWDRCEIPKLKNYRVTSRTNCSSGLWSVSARKCVWKFISTIRINSLSLIFCLYKVR